MLILIMVGLLQCYEDSSFKGNTEQHALLVPKSGSEFSLEMSCHFKMWRAKA